MRRTKTDSEHNYIFKIHKKTNKIRQQYEILISCFKNEHFKINTPSYTIRSSQTGNK